MKRTVVAALGVCPHASHAQSSVTLYGVVDAPVQFVNHMANGAPTVNTATGAITQRPGGNHRGLRTSGGLGGSRWGMRGSRISVKA